MSGTWSRALWTCLLVLGACGDDATPRRASDAGERADTGADTGAPDASDGRGPEEGTGTGKDGFLVRLKATSLALCRGECATLSVEVENGVQPYSYAWQPTSAGLDAASVEICPSAAGRYAVTVTDSAGGEGEFAGDAHTATAAVDVSVRSGCNPGAVQCSARIPFALPNTIGAHTIGESQVALATDAAGNAYLVGLFQGRIDFGGGMHETRGIADAFVLKIGSSCEFEWVKTFGGTGAMVGLSGLALANDGSMFAVGSHTGTINFGDQSHTAVKDSAFVLKLDAQGELLWSRSFSSGTHESIASDVGVTDQGEVVFGGYAGPDMSFGGAAIGGEVFSGIGVAYVASLSAEGSHRYSHAFRHSGTHAPLAVHSSGRVAISGYAAGTGNVRVDTGSFAVPGAGGGRYLVMLDATGSFSWGQPLPRTPPPGGRVTLSSLAGAGLVLTADGSVVVDQGAYMVEDRNGYIADPQRIEKFDAAGKLLWARARAFLGETAAGFWSVLAVDAQGNIVHGDLITPGASVDGKSLAVAGKNDVYLEKLTPTGELAWSKTLGGEFGEWAWGVAIDAEDSVWVAHTETTSSDDNNRTLVITKLDP